MENQKNKGVIPPYSDARVLAVPIGCGNCQECRKQRTREWLIRLLEEIKVTPNGQFITLTFSNEAYKKYYIKVQEEIEILKARIDLEFDTLENTKRLNKIISYGTDNQVATLATRQFLERWRKKYKKSVRHWLITELGHKGTENIHMHGIIWTEHVQDIKNIWQNGFVWDGYYKNERRQNYVNENTIKYCVKYANKMDIQHQYFKAKILTSAGIGSSFMQSWNAKKYTQGNLEHDYYTTSSGHKIALPTYYRNNMYTEEQREELWIKRLDKLERYVGGEKIDISKNDKEYFKQLDWYRERNKELGYGSDRINWKRKYYEEQRRILLQEARIKGK